MLAIHLSPSAYWTCMNKRYFLILREKKAQELERESEGEREGSAVDGEDGWAALIQWAFLIEFHYT